MARILIAAAGCLPSFALAQTWNVNADGNWNDAANWSPMVVPNAVDASVLLGTAIFDAHTVTLDIPVTLGTLTFDGGRTYTLAGSAPLTFDVSAGNARIIKNGSVDHHIQTDVILNDSLDITVNANSLHITGNISGSGGLATAGLVTLLGVNTYAGGTTIHSGTLVAGAHGIPGDVLNNGRLVFIQSTDRDYADTISGTGSVTKAGAGTLTLSGVHTYSGTTLIGVGTLIVNGSIVNSAITVTGGTLGGTGMVGDVTAGAAATVAPGNSIGTLNTGNFSLAGTLLTEFDGAGTMDRVNVTGTVDISGATLDLSAFGDVSTLGIATQGTIIANDGADAVIGTFGTVTGAGPFFVAVDTAGGDGNDVDLGLFRTGITLANGATNNEAVTFPTGFGNFTFTVEGADRATFSGTMGETGGSPVGVTKAGDGTLTLTGASSYTGMTTINAGTLINNGSLAGGATVNGGMFANNGTVNGAVTVAGGTYGGTGTSGALNATGGTVGPGNSIGTLTVNGALNLGAGSTYAVEDDAAGDTDLIDVVGTVTLGGGTLSVLAGGGGTYGASTDYIIIANDGADAVAGTFGAVTTDLAFLTPTVNYAGGTGNDVALNLARNATTFVAVSDTFNHIQSASGLHDLDQTAGTDSSTVYNTILGLTVAQARAVFDSTSGEVHASAQHAGAATFDLYRRALNEQGKAGLAGFQDEAPPAAPAYAGEAKAERAPAVVSLLGHADGKVPDRADARVKAGWISPLGGAGTVDGDGNAATLNWWTAGMAGGFEGRGYAGSGRFVAGVSAAYMRGGWSVPARASIITADSLDLGLYGAWSDGGWTVSGAAAYSATLLNASRDITVGALSRTATAAYWTHALGITAEAARNIDLGGVTLSPLATIDAGWSSHGGAAETGAGALNLTLAPEARGWLDTGLGVAVARRFTTASNRTVTVEARAVWEHAFGTTTPDQALSFAGSPTGFTVRGPSAGRDRLRLGAGFGMQLSGGTRFQARYEGTFFGGRRSHAANASLTVRF